MTTGYHRTIGVPLGFARTGTPDRDVDFRVGSYSLTAESDLLSTSALDTAEAYQSKDILEMIARALADIDTRILNIAGQLAGDDFGLSGEVPDRLRPVATLLREASVDQLEGLAASGAITLNDAMEVGLIALRDAGGTAEQSIVETGRLRRLLDRNANEIDAGQHRSRLMIEELLVG